MPKEAIHLVRKGSRTRTWISNPGFRNSLMVQWLGLCAFTAEKQGQKKKKSQIQVSPCVSSGHSSLSFLRPHMDTSIYNQFYTCLLSERTCDLKPEVRVLILVSLLTSQVSECVCVCVCVYVCMYTMPLAHYLAFLCQSFLIFKREVIIVSTS